ncbi:MAG TPA: DUF481 domain-containing protein [Vicinamibacterales bacterium]|nr:DUF481 domain-containing protein [Vicinamibacterales bacterium]
MSGSTLVILIGLLVWPARASAGPKVDVVQLRNGDRITCDINELQRGVLSVSTDPLDKVAVHWGEVSMVTSPREFELTLETGRRLYGSLAASTSPGTVVVMPAVGAPEVVPLVTIVDLVPIGRSVWGRMDGNVDVGFSFAQANLETHWTFNGGAKYRGRTWELSSSFASQLTAREDADRTSRNTVSLFGNRLFEDQWFANVLGQIQENEELQLALRTVSGGGVGRFVRRSPHVTLATYGGLVYTRERFVDEPTDNSGEIAVGGQLDAFTTRSNDFTLTNSVVSYFAVTGRARTRVELQTAWRHEFLSDFYWSLNALESFDSSPPSEEAKKNDFSVSLAFGWKF